MRSIGFKSTRGVSGTAGVAGSGTAGVAGWGAGTCPCVSGAEAAACFDGVALFGAAGVA